MCKWNEMRSGIPGLIMGCAISAIFLIGFLCLFLYYLHIPLSSIPIPVLLKQSTDSLQNEPCLLIAVLLFIGTWFSGIFFSTFARALAERLRDGTKNQV